MALRHERHAALPAIVGRFFRETPETQKLRLEIILAAPETSRLFEAQAERILNRRRDLAAQLAKARTERNVQGAKVAAVESEKRDVVKEVEAQLRAAEADLQAATSTRLSASNAADREIARLEGELAATADPGIEEYRRHLVDLHAEGLSGRLRHQLTREKRDPFSLKVLMEVFSNARELSARMERILTAIRQVDTLRYEPLTRAELAARMQAELASINEFPADTVEVQFDVA